MARFYYCSQLLLHLLKNLKTPEKMNHWMSRTFKIKNCCTMYKGIKGIFQVYKWFQPTTFGRKCKYYGGGRELSSCKKWEKYWCWRSVVRHQGLRALFCAMPQTHAGPLVWLCHLPFLQLWDTKKKKTIPSLLFGNFLEAASTGLICTAMRYL